MTGSDDAEFEAFALSAWPRLRRLDLLTDRERTVVVPGGGHLSVVATRTSANSYIGGGDPLSCAETIFPARQSCEVRTVGGQRVMVNDGVQYDGHHGTWARQVDVFYAKTTRETPAHVELSAYVDAPTWDQARDALPAADDLIALGLQPALELPAPDHYPVPDDIQDHMTSTP